MWARREVTGGVAGQAVLIGISEAALSKLPLWLAEPGVDLTQQASHRSLLQVSPCTGLQMTALSAEHICNTLSDHSKCVCELKAIVMA